MVALLLRGEPVEKGLLVETRLWVGAVERVARLSGFHIN